MALKSKIGILVLTAVLFVWIWINFRLYLSLLLTNEV